MSTSISYSEYRAFCRLWNTKQISHELRLGQAAYQYFGAEKCTQDVDWWNKLYDMDHCKAEKALLSIINHDN